MVNHPEADRKELHRQHQALKSHLDEENSRSLYLYLLVNLLIFTRIHQLKAKFSGEMGSEFIPKLSSSPKFINLAGCVTFQED